MAVFSKLPYHPDSATVFQPVVKLHGWLYAVNRDKIILCIDSILSFLGINLTRADCEPHRCIQLPVSGYIIYIVG